MDVHTGMCVALTDVGRLAWSSMRRSRQPSDSSGEVYAVR
ncbi:conserved hypothetical protein [Xanthomonas phaseoli pv. phaseoli]|uniref:Uncharacterized protein n=1 Tax=Xanthomonas campestris pv. phaseoli TaxID=317013 RepID=A0A7Z7J2X4_XANCH|nr:conserved hypothetical protein [Xanthomonas phaseoli pv. phaseoli]